MKLQLEERIAILERISSLFFRTRHSTSVWFTASHGFFIPSSFFFLFCVWSIAHALFYSNPGQVDYFSPFLLFFFSSLFFPALQEEKSVKKRPQVVNVSIKEFENSVFEITDKGSEGLNGWNIMTSNVLKAVLVQLNHG